MTHLQVLAVIMCLKSEGLKKIDQAGGFVHLPHNGETQALPGLEGYVRCILDLVVPEHTSSRQVYALPSRLGVGGQLKRRAEGLARLEHELERGSNQGELSELPRVPSCQLGAVEVDVLVAQVVLQAVQHRESSHGLGQ